MNGAVIVAAGLASRMGEFKPLMRFGNMSIIERIISTLQKAGVNEIVVVTGNQAKVLEHHLKNAGVIFLRNENYAQTQMFDSAKIGFRYLKDRCTKIVFTPADIPLYTSSTVQKLLSSKHLISYPIYHGKRGHPICLDHDLIEEILDYHGENGLKGALSFYQDIENIEVLDQGILYDADSKDDYARLLQIHNHQLFRPQLKIAVAKESVVINDEVAQLLYLIDALDSVREASVKMNMSYSKALKLIKRIEQEIKRPIVIRQPGGASGGSAYLSQDGHLILDCFRNYERELNEVAADLFLKHFQPMMQEGDEIEKSKNV